MKLGIVIPTYYIHLLLFFAVLLSQKKEKMLKQGEKSHQYKSIDVEESNPLIHNIENYDLNQKFNKFY